MPDMPTHHAIVGRKPLEEPRDAGYKTRDAIKRINHNESGWVSVDDLEL